VKILQLIQKPQLRGAEVFASQLSERLNGLGLTVDIVYLFGGENDTLNYKVNYIQLNANHKKRFHDFKAYKNLYNLIKNGGYDLVQANAGDTLKYAAISKYLYGWKQPLVFRNANYISGFINSAPKKGLNSLWVRQCAHVISVSESCRLDFISIFPSKAVKSSTITIGTQEFEEVKPSELRQDSNQQTESVFINIGSFVPEKNHLGLVDIFEDYLKRTNKGYLWLVGDGQMRAKIEEKIKQLGLSGRITLLGYRNDAVSLLKAADCLVMPSFIEGLPGVILEAMACGKPVIASNVGGISEAVLDEQTGFLLKPNDTPGFVHSMKLVMETNGLQEEMGEAGKKQVLNNFGMEKIASQFLEKYKQILEINNA